MKNPYFPPLHPLSSLLQAQHKLKFRKTELNLYSYCMQFRIDKYQKSAGIQEWLFNEHSEVPTFPLNELVMFLFHLRLTEIGQRSVFCEKFYYHSSEFWSDFPFCRHRITLCHTDTWPSLSFLMSIPWKNIRALFLLPVMLHWYHTGISETNSCITWNRTSPWLSVHQYKILRIPACWNMTWGIEITRRRDQMKFI